MIEKVKITEVIANPNNPRVIRDDKFKKLVKSINEFPEMLELRPIVVNDEMVVLGGNMRLKACKEAGLKEVHIIKASNLSEEQQAEFIIKDNVGFGEWDWDMLANEYDEQDLRDWGLDLPVFESINELEAEEDDFEEPESIIETDIVLGDLFEIGEHRLLCGDSTDINIVERLMDNTIPDFIHTDPPYGISHSGKGINGSTSGNDFGEILGDNDIDVAIDSFNLCKSLYPNATTIFWGANYYASALQDGFGWIVWDKQREGDTFSGAELAFVNKGIKVDVFRHQWHGMIKASEMGQKRVHPTQKPIALVEWCFNNYNAGKNVLDLFLGSGSTMVAAHQTNRKCYGMELDPKYCQVIIDRMLKLDPTLKVLRNGKPYEEAH